MKWPSAGSPFSYLSTPPLWRSTNLSKDRKRADRSSSSPGRRLPVCSHLDDALAVETAHRCLRQLLERFGAIESSLYWRRRTANDGSASANFPGGHANAMILGPGGYEERRDVWLGVSLMAPNVRYPDHDHAPEEVYLVLS
jgi:hypothetical protein